MERCDKAIDLKGRDVIMRCWPIIILIMVSSCSYNIEDTIIEGKDNHVVEESKQEPETKIKAALEGHGLWDKLWMLQ
jgi:hypothetical protein